MPWEIPGRSSSDRYEIRSGIFSGATHCRPSAEGDLKFIDGADGLKLCNLVDDVGDLLVHANVMAMAARAEKDA